jgi:Domain of unknown function (DUF927)
VHKTDRKSLQLKVVAIAEDEATREFIAIIEFRDINGQIRRIQQPKSILRKIGQLKEALDNAGASLPANDQKCCRKIRALSESVENAERWKYAPHVGWYDGHRAFVLPNKIIGQPRGYARILPPRSDNNEQRFKLTHAGDHKGWARSVAEPARYSSCMVLSICMALAGPLLDFMDFHSFGVLLSGPSKGGKSTDLVVAGSVIGFAREEDLPNFRTTDAAFGELPSDFNDMLMLINELGLLKGGKKDRSQRVRDLSYGFAGGRGTTYSKLLAQDNGNGSAKWRTLGLASGEETMDEIASAAGEIRSMGESIRWIDVRAIEPGANDIFDRCPKGISVEDRTEWARGLCQSLRKAAADNHGVAFNHFIKRVIRRRRKVAALLHPLIDEFIDAVADSADEPAVRHLASCFGLVRAAGILGVRFGTLPYSENLVERCIMRCYRAARRHLRVESHLLRSGLSRLRAKLKSSNMPKIVGKAQRRAHVFSRVDGYRDESGSTPKQVIRAEKFKGWFNDQRQPALVLRWLHSKRALPCKPALPVRSGNAIVWAESQPEWPDRSRPRSIVIELSESLLDRNNV